MTSKTVMLIKCVCLADGSPGPADQYLATYNPRTGRSEWTFDKSKALKFQGLMDALTLWQSVHETEPVRPSDGQPNRPLTEFTVTLEMEDHECEN